jgi:FkbM family methyltransferase
VKLNDLLYARFNSSLARRALTLVYRPNHIYRIPFGPLRGLRMRYHPSVNFHTILGLWEAETFRILERVLVTSGALADDSVVVDVGANVGYYAMWLSTVAAPQGYVYCFEPNPELLPIIRDNLGINFIENVDVVESACGDRLGATQFFLAPHHHSSSLHASWAGADGARKISVGMTTLDDFFAPRTRRREPAFIKFDIEGGGTHALPGCQGIIGEARPYILIESHTPDEDRAISNVICKFDYRAYRLNNRKWVEKPKAIHPDKDGVWGTVLLIPSETFARITKLLD